MVVAEGSRPAKLARACPRLVTEGACSARSALDEALGCTVGACWARYGSACPAVAASGAVGHTVGISGACHVMRDGRICSSLNRGHRGWLASDAIPAGLWRGEVACVAYRCCSALRAPVTVRTEAWCLIQVAVEASWARLELTPRTSTRQMRQARAANEACRAVASLWHTQLWAVHSLRARRASKGISSRSIGSEWTFQRPEDASLGTEHSRWARRLNCGGARLSSGTARHGEDQPASCWICWNEGHSSISRDLNGVGSRLKAPRQLKDCFGSTSSVSKCCPNRPRDSASPHVQQRARAPVRNRNFYVYPLTVGLPHRRTWRSGSRIGKSSIGRSLKTGSIQLYCSKQAGGLRHHVQHNRCAIARCRIVGAPVDRYVDLHRTW